MVNISAMMKISPRFPDDIFSVVIRYTSRDFFTYPYEETNFQTEKPFMTKMENYMVVLLFMPTMWRCSINILNV